ncbi:MAG: ribonuclease P protein component [Paludibacteraceae bacterium]|nr:ribonuclease P protein component [Paludibacteraceae bacterium]
MTNSFPKHSKLCGKERIAALYKSGNRFTSWPLRVTWQKMPDFSPSLEGRAGVGFPPSQILIWAPKSLFKHAVDRNRLRRLMREAYRLNQGILTSSSLERVKSSARSDCRWPSVELAGGVSYLIAFNYMDKEVRSYAVIEKAVIKALKRIANAQ